MGALKGTNDPCPTGYRVPSQAELTDLKNSFSPQSAEGAFLSPLKMPVAGIRSALSGLLEVPGSFGDYWSSTSSGFNNAIYLKFFTGFTELYPNYRAYGFSVRCIAN
jgi:hypothetical protein